MFVKTSRNKDNAFVHKIEIDRKIERLDLAPIVIPKDKGLAGAALKLRKVVSVADAYLDPRFNREFDIRSGYRTKQVAEPLDGLLMVS